MMSPDNVYMVHEEKSFDKNFILNFLEEHYFTRETLLTKFLQKHASEVTPAMRETMLADLRRRFDSILSKSAICLLGMHCVTERKVGIGFSILEKRQHLHEVPEWELLPIDSEMIAYWHRYVELAAERRVNFFEMFKDVNIIMKIVLISVEEQHENKQIATNMLREMIERSKKRGVDLIYGLFTSQRLRLIAEKFGFRSYGDMHLIDFQDPQGNLIYRDVAPHVVSVMAIKFN